MTEDQPPGAPRHILLTGRPGIGKTTVIVRLVERLQHLKVAGFYTEEMRERGQRRGFRATTFSDRSIVMAHVDIKTRHRVGRYGVDVPAFEQLVLPELARPADLILIDEIGKMECFSSSFVSTVRSLLDAATPVIATVAVSGGGFIAEVKSRPDVEILNVTYENRSDLPKSITSSIRARGGPPYAAGWHPRSERQPPGT
jgi:nucleoside-triphosphatase